MSLIDDVLTQARQYSPRVWQVVFIRRERESWWDALTAPWARHVMAWGYNPRSDSWLVFDPQVDVTRVCIVPDAEFCGWQDGMLPHISRIVRIDAGAGSPGNARLAQFCAQQVSRLVGVRSGAFRPQALYRHLMEQGATLVYEEAGRGNQNQSRGSGGGSGREKTSRAGTSRRRQRRAI